MNKESVSERIERKINTDTDMKVIQIYGPIGVGKTYILEKVQNILEEKGYNTFHKGDIERKKDIGYRRWLERNDSFGKIGSFLIEHLPKDWGAELLVKNGFLFDRAEHYGILISKYSELINSLTTYLRKIYPDKVVGKYINMFLELLSLYEYAKDEDIDIYLTDEQFFQKILMYFSQLNIKENVENHPSRRICRQFVMDLAKHMEEYIDLNILVSASPQTCIQRQNRRSQPSIHDGFSRHERIEELKEWKRRGKMINENLDIKSFEVENGNKSEVVIDEIITLLNI